MMSVLDQGLQELPPKKREIFLRFYLYGEKTSLIAKTMGISESSVRTELHRIRTKLKEYMSERGYDNV